MDKPSSNLDFQLMSLSFKVRDFLFPRRKVLGEVGIQPGFKVLDYGCGPGSYITPLAELVGQAGEIYALDIHPLAIKKVQRLALRQGLTIVKAIQSDCKTGLPDDSMDVVLLYDIFHALSQPDEVLQEICRILKPTGVLSFNDHHMQEQEIRANLIKGKLFKLVRKGMKTYTFAKE